MRFEVTASDPGTKARCCILQTAHGQVRTPVFMPVGTQGAVKAMHPDQLQGLGADVILANTYHLSLRPGAEAVGKLGGLHSFCGWPRTILTDSGGFQIYSMGDRHSVSEEGVSFYSHIDGSRHFMSPESCLDLQYRLGSDIIMVLDHCLPYPSAAASAREAMQLTCRWASRSAEHHRRRGRPSALFAIQQGGFNPELRRTCAELLGELEFDGFAVGGISVGEPKDMLLATALASSLLLPDTKPRYVMGVGPPEDLLALVSMGYDMFDCVLPTRNARTGTLFTSRGKIAIKNARYKLDEQPIDPACGCQVCAKFSRAYLRHLFVSGEILAPMLNTYHNLAFFLSLMSKTRDAISDGSFVEFRDSFLSTYNSGADDEP